MTYVQTHHTVLMALLYRTTIIIKRKYLPFLKYLLWPARQQKNALHEWALKCHKNPTKGQTVLPCCFYTGLESWHKSPKLGEEANLSRWCYELNVCAPPKFICLKPWPPVWRMWRQGLWEVIRVTRGHAPGHQNLLGSTETQGFLQSWNQTLNTGSFLVFEYANHWSNIWQNYQGECEVDGSLGVSLGFTRCHTCHRWSHSDFTLTLRYVKNKPKKAYSTFTYQCVGI